VQTARDAGLYCVSCSSKSEFNRHAYCAIELKKGEAAKSVAKKFRDMAAEVERLEKGER
jgi:hypothetical protein